MCLIVTMVGVDDIPKLADLGLEMIGLIWCDGYTSSARDLWMFRQHMGEKMFVSK